MKKTILVISVLVVSNNFPESKLKKTVEAMKNKLEDSL